MAAVPDPKSANGRSCQMARSEGSGPFVRGSRSGFRAGLRLRALAALLHELVEFGLVTRLAQLAEEVHELLMFVLEAAQGLLAVGVERAVARTRRTAEAARLGFRGAVVPEDSGRPPEGMRAVAAGDVGRALQLLGRSLDGATVVPLRRKSR